MSKSQKHIFCVDDDYYFVARDVDHVIKLYSDEVDVWGPDRLIDQIPDDQPFEIAFAGFEGEVDSGNARIPDSAKIREVCEADTINGDEYQYMVVATAGEWAAANTPGGICQTIWD